MVKGDFIMEHTNEILIGKTKFIVTTSFKDGARETAKEKMYRIIKNKIKMEIAGGKPII
jgi:hypothetical protein